jgi:uncharacterized 2Fe-2S/4Fe-4S cluster protein (DUF4445 family)
MHVRVTFQEGITEASDEPRRSEAVVQVGHNLLEVAQSKGVAINAPCGGRAQCGKCLVRVIAGPAPISEGDRRLLSPGMLAEGLRLACQLRPRLATTVEVQNRFDLHADPVVRPAPRFDPARRATRAIVAVDLGSTSVQMRVFDASDLGLLGELSVLNKQVRRGHDVMTRMTYALRGPEARRDLTEDARETLRALWNAARRSLVAPDGVAERWTVAGNSVMTHLLWGEPIESLAEAPYKPAFVESRTRPAHEAGLPGGTLTTLPLLGSFVGGDTAAALLALRFDDPGPPRMMVDIGTNTEVALAHGETIRVCSTPAGPAFEGGNISVGMRAEVGAITSIDVREDGAIRAHTIGGVKAKGICGTGLIQVVVALVRAGLVSRDGAIASGADRIALSRGVELMQSDIRELQLAKGALRTAVRIVLAEAGLRDADLASLQLAGAFGTHLTPRTAIDAGMLPSIDPGRVAAVGNASLDGAERFALDPDGSARRLEAIRARIRHVELATRDDFQALFVQSLSLGPG